MRPPSTTFGYLPISDVWLNVDGVREALKLAIFPFATTSDIIRHYWDQYEAMLVQGERTTIFLVAQSLFGFRLSESKKRWNQKHYWQPNHDSSPIHIWASDYSWPKSNHFLWQNPLRLRTESILCFKLVCFEATESEGITSSSATSVSRLCAAFTFSAVSTGGGGGECRCRPQIQCCDDALLFCRALKKSDICKPEKKAHHRKMCVCVAAFHWNILINLLGLLFICLTRWLSSDPSVVSSSCEPANNIFPIRHVCNSASRDRLSSPSSLQLWPQVKPLFPTQLKA